MWNFLQNDGMIFMLNNEKYRLLSKKQMDHKVETTTLSKKNDDIIVISSTGTDFALPLSKLQKTSLYFQCLCRSGMKEWHDRKVKFPALTDKSLRGISEYLSAEYTELIITDIGELEDILEAASYLQMLELMDFCIMKLTKLLSLDNATHILSVANQHYVHDLTGNCYTFLHDNFADFSLHPTFLEMDLPAVARLLGHEKLLVTSEKEVFTAAVAWIKNHRDYEKESYKECQVVVELMETVRWPLMKSTDLEYCTTVLKQEHWISECEHLLLEHESHTKDSYLIHGTTSSRVMPRRPSSCVMVLGGFTSSEHSTNRVQIARIDKLVSESKELVLATSRTEKLPTPLCEHCACAMNGFIYVAGGQFRYTQNGKYTSDLVYRLDTRYNRWITVASMSVPRSLFYMGELGGCLYAVCGWTAPNRVTKTVEKYIPRLNMWKSASSLDIGIHEHAGVALDDKIYVTGGFRGPMRGHINQLSMYDPTTDTWSYLTPMHQARSYHAMVAVANSLLVMGGVCYNDDDSFSDITACELYDIASDQWSLVSNTPKPASCMSCVQLDNLVFLFGGHSFEDDNNHTCLLILNTKDWKWRTMPMKTNGILHFSAVKIDCPEKYLESFYVNKANC